MAAYVAAVGRELTLSHARLASCAPSAAIADFQTKVDLQEPIVALAESVRNMDGEPVDR